MSLRFLVLGDLHYDTPATAPFEPAPGAVVGFDAAYRDRPLLGAPVKVHDRPAVWARVRLDQPNVTRAGRNPESAEPDSGFRVPRLALFVFCF